MVKSNIRELQMSALSKINFCFYELKKFPPLQWENDIINNESLEKTKEKYKKLNFTQQSSFSKTLFTYLDRESTTEARIMLIINYLFALLIKHKHNGISVHQNFNSKQIEEFSKSNSDLLARLTNARNKLYSHIDLNYLDYAKGITFDEFQKCIDFLNELFDYRVFY